MKPAAPALTRVARCSHSSRARFDPLRSAPSISLSPQDVRNPTQPLNVFAGHSYAVRRVKWSPHSENVLFSCSYDMTLAMWNTSPGQEPLLRRWDQHTEFVVGMDVSTLAEGLVASTGAGAGAGALFFFLFLCLLLRVCMHALTDADVEAEAAVLCQRLVATTVTVRLLLFRSRLPFRRVG